MDVSAVESASGAWCSEIAGGVEAGCSARELLTERLGDSTPAGTMYDLHLLATELVTNAVLHAGVDETATVELRVATTADLVHVSVTDPGSDATSPAVQDLDVTVPGGMGLFLVEQISRAWGVERRSDGSNRVWFELAA
jgi:anti-sigma regulatory factor (Ser/Thr protein kinase)